MSSRSVMLARIGAEASKADELFGDFSSAHEGYGVLAEEVAELFDAVRLKQSKADRWTMVEAEAIQVAAVALRIAEQAGAMWR